jgi:hypothetical protein
MKGRDTPLIEQGGHRHYGFVGHFASSFARW